MARKLTSLIKESIAFELIVPFAIACAIQVLMVQLFVKDEKERERGTGVRGRIELILFFKPHLFSGGKDEGIFIFFR